MVTLDNYLFFAWAERKMMYKCTYFDENFFPQMEYRLDRQKEILHMKKLGKKQSLLYPPDLKCSNNNKE